MILALTTFSAVIGWEAAGNQGQREWIIGAFALAGFINIVWSALFFRLRHLDWGLFEVSLLWMIGPTRHSRRARPLLVPYLARVSFATILNSAVVRLNAPF